MNFEVLSFQMIYNLWWLQKHLTGKKDNEKKSANRPTGGTVTVKGFKYWVILIKYMYLLYG